MPLLCGGTVFIVLSLFSLGTCRVSRIVIITSTLSDCNRLSQNVDFQEYLLPIMLPVHLLQAWQACVVGGTKYLWASLNNFVVVVLCSNWGQWLQCFVAVEIPSVDAGYLFSVFSSTRGRAVVHVASESGPVKCRSCSSVHCDHTAVFEAAGILTEKMAPDGALLV